jgi:hypothetical protein
MYQNSKEFKEEGGHCQRDNNKLESMGGAKEQTRSIEDIQMDEA